jgi:hypothetical protein
MKLTNFWQNINTFSYDLTKLGHSDISDNILEAIEKFDRTEKTLPSNLFWSVFIDDILVAFMNDKKVEQLFDYTETEVETIKRVYAKNYDVLFAKIFESNLKSDYSFGGIKFGATRPDKKLVGDIPLETSGDISLQTRGESQIIEINGKKFTKFPSIRQTDKQFKNITNDEFNSLLIEVKKLAESKIKLIKDNVVKVISDEEKYFITKQGNNTTKNDKDSDFSINNIAKNMFTGLVDFLQTKKLFDYDFLQYKLNLQREKNYLHVLVADAEHLIRTNKELSGFKFDELSNESVISAMNHWEKPIILLDNFFGGMMDELESAGFSGNNNNNYGFVWEEDFTTEIEDDRESNNFRFYFQNFTKLFGMFQDKINNFEEVEELMQYVDLRCRKLKGSKIAEESDVILEFNINTPMLVAEKYANVVESVESILRRIYIKSCEYVVSQCYSEIEKQEKNWYANDKNIDSAKTYFDVNETLFDIYGEPMK